MQVWSHCWSHWSKHGHACAFGSHLHAASHFAVVAAVGFDATHLLKAALHASLLAAGAEDPAGAALEPPDGVLGVPPPEGSLSFLSVDADFELLFDAAGAGAGELQPISAAMPVNAKTTSGP
jgi:hypothetical protein